MSYSCRHFQTDHIFDTALSMLNPLATCITLRQGRLVLLHGAAKQRRQELDGGSRALPPGRRVNDDRLIPAGALHFADAVTEARLGMRQD
jgi:hypothetical protein